MAKKRILFVEDLYDFYINKYKKSTQFSAEKTGHQIFVQVPAQFEVVENEYKDDSLLFCKVKLMHSGENRNHSCVTDEALNKASKGLAYKPILANFMEYTDEKTGEILKDFTSHDMEVTKDGINYIEKQIGCFTSDEPYFEIEEETGHNFLYGYCAIPREYTDATSIIERKGGTKISVELAINEMTFNAKSKVLELTDVVIMGATCLGKNPETLEDIGEGMLNARLDIADFGEENNSFFANYDFTLVELQERLEKLESACFNNTNEKSKEGGTNNKMTKFEELLAKYGKTAEDVTFDYSEMSDEELEAKFAEMFDDDNSDGDNSGDGESGEPSNDGEGDGEGASDPDGDKGESQTFEKMVRTYELSHEDVRCALYELLASYEELDNDYFYISNVFDNYFVYEGWVNNKIYRQGYTKDGDNISFDGERIELFRELLTASEKAELESMRSNYAALKEFKETAEKNELHAQREALLADEKYSVLVENEAFAKLVSEMDNYSLADLEKEAKVIFADHVASVGKFSLNTSNDDRSHSMKLFGNPNTRKNSRSGRYGDIFKK